MQFELRVSADFSDDQFANLLTQLAAISGMPVTTVIPSPVNGGGLPLTQEAFAAAARASQANAAAEPPAAVPTPPKPRGRPRKEVTGTVVNGPDGEPAAVMTQPDADTVDEPVDDGVTDVEATVATIPDFPVIKDNPLTASEMRDKAIALLQSVFGKPQGPVEVRSLQTKFKIKKFNEVPDTMCKDLLNAAQDLHARIMATQG